MRLKGKFLPVAAVAVAALWLVGFAQFNAQVRQIAPDPPPADGIVVLTGGADRVETGLRLLAEGRAPRLLVSGVGHGTDLAEMAKRVNLDPAEIEEQVTLGRHATSTVGNAEETASWVQKHRMRRVILVTAGYHMPRALLEIGRALPGITIYPVPVQPPALRGQLDFATMRLLASEYDKLLAVRLGLTRLVHAGAG